MLTFEGKSFNYYKNKEKDPPNKEASPNRFLLEKLYRVHRQRVLYAKSAVDTYVEIPDFLKNASNAKEQAKEHQLNRIARENETIYKRIARAENAESQITKEANDHIKRVEHELILMERLKKMGRGRGIIKTNRENEDILMRIERARPAYSRKHMIEWYKHHELFKKGRKSDPTAGHLGFRGMKGLMPTSLPPVTFDPTISSSSSSISNIDLAVQRSKRLAQRVSLTLNSLNSPDSVASSSLSSSPSKSPYNKSNKLAHLDMSSPTSDSYYSSPLKLSIDTDYGGTKTANSASSGMLSTRSSDRLTPAKKRKNTSTKNKKKSRESTPSAADDSGNDELLAFNFAAMKEDDREGEDSIFSNIKVDVNYIALVSKMCSIPFEDMTVIMQILVNKSYEECILLRLLESIEPHNVLLNREVDIDVAFEILNSYGSMMLNSDSVDLKSLRGQLIGLFQELDSDKSGYLSFDEFSDLMARSQVGIRNEDLRHVLVDADDNGNGVVDYAEFVPLAIDMIQAFRTKSQALAWAKHKERQIDEEVFRRMKRIDIAFMVDSVLFKIAESDPKKTGSLRLSDLRKHLTMVSSKVGLTDVEIAYVMRHATKDGMGRVKYNNIGELLSRGRFILLKHGLLEETGNEIYKYMINVCHKLELEEEKNTPVTTHESEHVPGMITLRSMSKALRDNEKYPLTILQASVLLSDDAIASHLHDGKIDYYSALHIISKSIEILRSPQTLRQRAELIDPLAPSLDSSSLLNAQSETSFSAVSPQAGDKRQSMVASPPANNKRPSLVPGSPTSKPSTAASGTKFSTGASSSLTSFERRLKTLFTTSDKDKSNSLNDAEFILCLQLLELNLTEGEILTLKQQADTDKNGELSFSEFCAFFTRNLAGLERMKELRALHATLHHESDVFVSSNDASVSKQLADQLLSVFKLSDPSNLGTVDIHEFEAILGSLDIEISSFQMSVLLSEAMLDSSGLVRYDATIPVLVDLLRSYLSKDELNSEEKHFEVEASRKAYEITLSSSTQLYSIISFIYQGLLVIENEFDRNDHEHKYFAIQNLLKSPHCGLTQTEATYLLTKLFSSSKQKYVSQAADSAGVSFAMKHPLEVSDMHRKAFASNAASAGQSTVLYKNLRKTSLAPGGTGMTKIKAIRSMLVADDPPLRGSINIRATQPTPMRSLEEVTDAVFDARVITVKRGILQKMPVAAIEKLLFTALLHARDVSALNGTCQPNSIYVPIRDCFEILEQSHHLRLTRPQIMGIVSWTECLDPSSKLVDFASFATYAAQMIKRLQNPNVQEARANIVRMLSESAVEIVADSCNDEDYDMQSSMNAGSSALEQKNVMVRSAALNGLTEKEMDEYLIEAFTNAQLENEEIEQKDFLDILVNIPKLKLTMKDASTVAAAFPALTNGRIYWPEFIPFAHTTLMSLCLERLLARRMILGGGGSVSRSGEKLSGSAAIDINSGNIQRRTSSYSASQKDMVMSNTDSLESAIEGDEGDERGEEAISALRKLAAGIIEHIEVRVVNDEFVCLLPGEHVEDLEVEADEAIDDDHSVASLESLDVISLGSISSPTIIDILKRRKPSELRLQIDEVDPSGTHHFVEEEFNHENSEVEAVELFDQDVDISVLILQSTVTETRKSEASKKSSPSGTPSQSPALTRRKTFFSPVVMTEPANSKLIRARLTVLCAEPEVLTLDRQIIVRATRTSGLSLMGNSSSNLAIRSKVVSVQPFDVMCNQTIPLPSICLVDAHAAVEFASTLSDQLYLEVSSEGKILALNLKDDKYYHT